MFNHTKPHLGGNVNFSFNFLLTDCLRSDPQGQRHFHPPWKSVLSLPSSDQERQADPQDHDPQDHDPIPQVTIPTTTQGRRRLSPAVRSARMKVEIGRVIIKVFVSFSFMLFECICVVFGSLVFVPLEDRTLGGSARVLSVDFVPFVLTDQLVQLFVYLASFGKLVLSFGKHSLHSLHVFT